MFTKEDFSYYFDQLLAIEIEMMESYTDLSNRVQHPEYKKLFSEMAKEEKAHAELIEELKQKFESRIP